MNISNLEVFLALNEIKKSPSHHVAIHKIERFIENHVSRINKKGFPSFITFTAQELIDHLEPLMMRYDFMTWDTYGTLWNIDHVFQVSHVNCIDDAIRCSMVHNFYPSYIATNKQSKLTSKEKVANIEAEAQRLNTLLNPPSSLLQPQRVGKLANALKTHGYKVTPTQLGILIKKCGIATTRKKDGTHVTMDVPGWLRLRSYL